MKYFSPPIRPVMGPAYQGRLGERMREVARDEGHRPRMPDPPRTGVGCPASGTPEPVRKRRDKVLGLKLAGASNLDIAEALGVALHIVRNDIQHLRIAGRL